MEQLISGSGEQHPLIINPDGSLNVAGTVTSVDFSLSYIQAMSYNSDGLVEYMGLASPGTNKSGATWQIRKLIYDGMNVVDVLFASGNNLFDKVWDWRTGSYTYA